MGFLHRVLGASWLARAGKGLERMIDLDQRRKVTTEAIAKKAWDTQDHSRRHLDELQSTVKSPWANKHHQDEPELWGKADPDPLPPVLTQRGTFAVRPGLLGMFAPDEVPHLIKLHLGDGQLPQQVYIDLFSLLGGSPQPLQDGGFRHTQDKANVRERDFDQEHFQRHDDLLFRGLQIKKDGVACLGEGPLTLATEEDASFATLG